MMVTPPPPMRIAYPPILALRTAYRYLFCLAYFVPFNNKVNNFWRFHLHKENKMKYNACTCTIILENVSFDVFACYVS